jgi:hypothetical protein
MYVILLGDCKGKKTLGGPRRRWEVNFGTALGVRVYEDIS